MIGRKMFKMETRRFMNNSAILNILLVQLIKT